MKKLTIVALSLTLIGSLLLAIFTLSGGIQEISGMILPNFIFPKNAITSNVKLVEPKSTNLELPQEDFESIVVDIELNELVIRQVDLNQPKLTYESNNALSQSDRFKFSVENKTLHIRSSDKYKNNIRVGFLFMLPQPYEKIILELPRKMSLQSVQLNLDMGELLVENVSCQQLGLDLKMGSAKIENSQIKTAQLELDMGALEIEGGTIEASKMNLNMGDLNLSTKLLGKHEIDCDMGSATLNLPYSRERVLLKTDLSMGELKSNVPNVEESPGLIQAQPLAELDIDLDMGSLTVNFKDTK